MTTTATELAPPRPAAAPAAPPPSGTPLSHLFRHSLRAGQTHPLLHVLRRHRGDTSPLEVAAAVAPPPAPLRQPVDVALLRQRLRHLPAMPAAVQRALAAIADDNASTADCARLIERDQGITAATLKVANSAFFGVPGRVATVRGAIDLLGLRHVSMILASAALASRFGSVRCPGFVFERFWRHAVGTAVAARAVATRRGVDPALAFIAGLLHDIGRLALALQCPAELAEAAAWARAADVQIGDAECAVLGTEHAATGGEVAAAWNFPAVVTAAIAAHHAPPPSPAATVSDAVHFGDAIAHALDFAEDDGEAVPPLDAAACLRVNLDAAQLVDVLAEVERGVDEICKVFGGA